MKARLLSILIGIAVVMSLSAGAVSASDPPGTVTLQPGPGLNNGTDDGSATKGKDTWINNASPTSPSDGAFYLWNISCNQYRGRGLLRFSLDGLPKQNITSARVYMYTSVYFNGSGWVWPAGDQKVSLRKLTSDWNEKTVSWDNPPGFDPAIIDPKVVHTTGVAPPNKEFQDWLSFDITDLYKGWANGSIPNNGIMLYLDTSVCQNGDEFTMYTSDWADASLRPKLVVTAASGGTAGGGTTGSTGSTTPGPTGASTCWAGNWQSSGQPFGDLTITQSGSQLTGVFSAIGKYKNFSGTVSGNTCTGKMQETVSGAFVDGWTLSVAPDCQKLTFSWIQSPGLGWTWYRGGAGAGTGAGTGVSTGTGTTTGTGTSTGAGTGSGSGTTAGTGAATSAGTAWGGTWKSTWKTDYYTPSMNLTLKQNGSQVSGDSILVYSGSRVEGKLTGTVSGNKYKATGTFTYISSRVDHYAFTLAPDGQSMTVVWDDPSESFLEPGAVYTLTRTGAGTGTTTIAGTGTSTTTGAGTATGAGAALTAESRTADPNSIVQVPIRLDNAGNIGSMNFVLTYNPQVIKVNKVDGGSLVSGALFTPNYKSPPQVNFGLASSAGINGSGTVAYIEFQVIGAAGSSSPLTLSGVNTTDTSGRSVTLTTSNGTVTVASETGPGSKPKGDYNGDGKVTELDALAALKMSVKLLEEDLNLDMNDNGKVTAEDARLILKQAVGKGNAAGGTSNYNSGYQQ